MIKNSQSQETNFIQIDTNNKNPNHPKKDSAIKVEPIRKKKNIEDLKKILRDRPRDYCLFVFGINTAYRANELLSITVGQARNLREGDILELKQSKNKRYRMVKINSGVMEAVRYYLRNDKKIRKADDEDFLFYSRKGKVLSVESLSTAVKEWCKYLGLKGNYASHSLRKTWGYWQYKRGTQLPILVEAFGHATQQQTLSYLCIPSEDVQAVFDMVL